jgi:Protein of unknown function (DUF1616)
MYRNRNIDIALATIVALLGGLAAAKHLPGQVTIPLGTALFFAPGYLWSEAILSQRLPGVERAMTTVGMALILPILGGFLFYGLHIPLFKSSWVGLLVVLTLLGVVAVAIQRLRVAPVGRPQQPGRGQPPPRQGGSVVLHSFIFGLAAVIGIGTVAFSVKNAEAQKFPGYTALSMTAVVNNAAAQNAAILSNDPVAQENAAQIANNAQSKATQAHLVVTNHQAVPEQYKLELRQNGKLTNTWPITLNDGQTWQKTIAWTTNHSMLADLYLLPNVSTSFHHVNNGTCIFNNKVLPLALRSEIPPCGGKL